MTTDLITPRSEKAQTQPHAPPSYPRERSKSASKSCERPSKTFIKPLNENKT